MNKRNLGERIKLTSYEEMFGTKNNNSTSGQIVQKSECRNIKVKYRTVYS